MSKTSSSEPTGNFFMVFIIAFVGVYGVFMILGGILSMSGEPPTPLEQAQTDCLYQGLEYDEALGECR